MLADRLTALVGEPDVIVLGLVRGGVPVARVVAERLGAPLDVLVVRKLGMPWAPEVAFGALGPGGVQVLNDAVASRLSSDDIAEVSRREQAELERRERLYRGGRPPLDLTGRTAVDRRRRTGHRRDRPRRRRRSPANSAPHRVVVAVPVGARGGVRAARRRGRPGHLRPAPARTSARSSGYYDDFHEVSDDEVTEALTATA